MGGKQVWTAEVAPAHTVLEYADFDYRTSVNTGVIANENTSIEYKFQYYNNPPARGSSTSANFTLWKSPNGRLNSTFSATFNAGNYINWGHFGRSAIMTHSSDQLSTRTRYILKITPSTGYLNSVGEKALSGTVSGTETANMLIKSYESSCPHRVFYFKIWDGDVLIRDFIPVLLEDGTVSFYDQVNKTYTKPSRTPIAYA